ncbi:UV excision repair protein Rad23 [Myriangium duriaei CBS 260.36]|uniref:UV excision repair protein RAD23 n=1 Tax=Myriangium duriaei CBS 260.36 TaxID=1168546 RepID=A0A9P4J678_9PEZI|nr:UV excision repair protein Rad23 [Myriangium duriaei CBS 260.36]
MKLTFKDLKHQKFTIDAEPSESIGDVKAKIAAEKGWDASSQKLIYSGKILQDDKTVESYKIEEKGFIVCMTQKPKPAPSSQAAPSTPAPAAVAETPAAPQAPPQSNTSNTAIPATPSPAPGAAPSPGGGFNDPSALAMGTDARNQAIADMEQMGFARAEIDRAMRAAFYNPDRAVEYLLTGIPESAQQEERSRNIPASAAAGNTQAPPSQTGGAVPQGQGTGEQPLNLFDEAAAQGGRGGAGGNRGGEVRPGSTPAANLDFLRNNPQFQQLRQVVQQQPQMLEPILQQVVQGNPQVAQIIANHPDQFMQLLAEDADDDAALPAGVQPISVTEEEREAIERLCRLGFEREMVIQAYFACDKNEELAANFLFDQPEDDEQQ